MNLSELDRLPSLRKTAPSLEPIRGALQRSGVLEKIDASRVIVVAGTNGKGSTCAVLDALLRSTGARVGLFTSPHLIRPHERIRINGQEISDVELQDAFGLAESIGLSFREQGLSHFEAWTWLAAQLFFQEQLGPTHRVPVDWAILEVGLGGLWDATNAIPHQHCAIARLGFDHQALLGESLGEIASQKLGIIPPAPDAGLKTTVAHLPFEPEAAAVAQALKLRQPQVRWTEAPTFETEVVAAHSEHAESPERRDPQFFVHTPWGKIQCPLPGKRGAENAMLALQIFENLGFAPGLHLDALSRVAWPGRMERLSLPAPCPVYLSGDHNPQGVESLLELLTHYPRRHLHFLVGIGAEKKSEPMLRLLAKVPDASITLTVPEFKGKLLEHYSTEEKNLVSRAFANPLQALQSILTAASPDDLIVVTGSLYLVGQIRGIAENSRSPG